MNGTEVKRVREAMGREVSQLDLGVMLGLNLASVEVSKREDEGASGPEAVALSYLSQGLLGFRGDLPECRISKPFIAGAANSDPVLVASVRRHDWPKPRPWGYPSGDLD